MTFLKLTALEGIPTIGDWLQEAGYSTHYFGKWHISGEATENLLGYGFDDWEQSYPDPHGYLPNNLGFYRDFQFRDLVTSFLRRQGLGLPYDRAHAKQNVDDKAPDPVDPPNPWFAVASFTNPHDIASYPGLPRQVFEATLDGQSYTLKVPFQDDESNAAESGTMKITLNQAGLEQENAKKCATWDEILRDNNKPECQFDYAYKMGLVLTATPSLEIAKSEAKEAAKQGQKWSRQRILDRAIELSLKADLTGLPLALTPNTEVASRAFMQYYCYLISEVNQHINAVLEALVESGQDKNTIVIFCPDHGEYGAAHQMMTEKWHTGYEEVLHVPMVVRFPEGEGVGDSSGNTLRQISEPSSHIDILPTILGLAGVSDIDQLMAKISDHKPEKPKGSDLSSLIKTGAGEILDNNNERREGVLFINYDTPSQPLTIPKLGDGNPLTAYEVFVGAVKDLIECDPEEKGFPDEVNQLEPSHVMQPSSVHCVVDRDNWKLVRYLDLETNRPDQYEMYDLNTDKVERYNLVVFNDFPKLYQAPGETLTTDQITQREAKATSLKELMTKLETQMLSP